MPQGKNLTKKKKNMMFNVGFQPYAVHDTYRGLAKQRKERSFCERKFCLRKEGFDIHLIVNTSSNS